MAFDMIIVLSGAREHIAHNEEMFLRIIEELDLDCPLLSKLWETDFYDSPKIHHTQSIRIAEELILVEKYLPMSSAIDSDKRLWAKATQRLQRFFREAASLQSVIETHSD